MSTLLGILGISDVDTRLAVLSTEQVYDAVNQVAAQFERERDEAFRVFVQDTTTMYQSSYKLPGSGYMQRLDRHGRPLEERPAGSFTTAYPLETFGTGYGWDRETYAYMTAADLDNMSTSAMIRNANSHRFEIAKAFFNKTNATFVDPLYGSLTIRRLANSDGTLYPPVIGSDAEADDLHYVVSGYTAANISDTNNPFVTIRDMFMERNSGGQIVAFINPAQRAKVEALAAFVDKTPEYTVAGQDTAVLAGGLPSVPGNIIGAVSDVLVSEWRAGVPANYIASVDLGLPGPLRKREHPHPELQGFRLEAEEETDPLFKRTWRDRFGYGAGNRLNGVAMELTTDGTYDTPAAYA